MSSKDSEERAQNWFVKFKGYEFDRQWQVDEMKLLAAEFDAVRLDEHKRICLKLECERCAELEGQR